LVAGLVVPIPKFLLNDHASQVEPYVKHAAAPSTVIPAPSAAAALAAPHAIVMFKSSTSKVAVLIVVVVPFTVKSPPIVKLHAIATLPVV